MQPKIIIHGGAGSSLQGKGGAEAVRLALYQILETLNDRLVEGATAQETVVLGCQLLENEPRFNAGTGAVLQSDGQIRLSASLMDGATQRFSGVINASRVKNPIHLAQYLQGEADRVLSDQGSIELARELALPVYNPVTDLRLREWMEDRKMSLEQKNPERKMAGVIAEGDTEAGRGTIGVVVLDQAGHIAAGTSTGGKGFERIGRVSDSAMPAGNYATALAGVSCTGIGEDIIEECLAARIVIRVTDGLRLEEAFNRSFREAGSRQRDLGAIGLSAAGTIAWGKTSEILLAAYHTGSHLGDTLEMEPGIQVGWV